MTVTIQPNDPGIYYSPANWVVGASSALTINAGAYFKVGLVSATTCVLNFDISAMPSPQSQLYWRVDRYGAWTKVTLSSGTVTISFPPDTSEWTEHFLEVYVKSVTEQANRWAVGSPRTAVVLTSITLNNGASVALPLVAPKQVVIFGDSIPEGVKIVKSTSPNNTDSNDATLSFAAQLGPMIGAEVGIVGFGSQGWIAPGNPSSDVPAFTGTYNLVCAGVSRSFAGIDLVVIMQGQNDGATNTTTQVTTVLNGLATAGYGGIVILVEPISSTVGPQQEVFLLAGRAASSIASRTLVIDTKGFFDETLSSDAIHPYGIAGIVGIAPRLAALISPLLWSAIAEQRRFSIAA